MYANPRQDKWYQQKKAAKKRGIEFLLTFDEWFAIWKKSGKLKFRGRCKGQYVMARPGDVGVYEVGNVKIVSVTENRLERRPEMATRDMTKWGATQIGHPVSAATREKLRYLRSAETCRKQSIAHSGAYPSAATRKKMSEAHKRCNSGKAEHERI